MTTHDWRKGRDGVYTCALCGEWTANKPLYKDDPCDKTADWADEITRTIRGLAPDIPLAKGDEKIAAALRATRKKTLEEAAERMKARHLEIVKQKLDGYAIEGLEEAANILEEMAKEGE